MHSLSHRLIVLLLLLLQGFTPLVHAHVGQAEGFNSDNGIHIDGLGFASAGDSQLSDFDQVGYYPLAIGINSAIQQKQDFDECSESFCFAVIINSVLPFRKHIEKLIGFSPPVIGFYSFFPSDSAPRAPPFPAFR
jgi:hypothetical protein